LGRFDRPREQVVAPRRETPDQEQHLQELDVAPDGRRRRPERAAQLLDVELGRGGRADGLQEPGDHGAIGDVAEAGQAALQIPSM
jgi:hypothetical protein